LADLLTRLRLALAGRYTIDRELGRGGMATVYLARDLKHDRRVALKVLHPELAAALGQERFHREIMLAARLQHPHILTVLDSGEAAAQLWFTMPFVEGESLRDRLNREKQLPVEDALRIAREAAEALDYAHRSGVVHRDVKPENVLLTEGYALVADFGIARALGGGEQQLTSTGIVIGTPAYMSPEQASGTHELDARTDVYALGCVLYEMLAGEPPYTGPTAQAIIARALTEAPRPIHPMRAGVPEAVDAMIAKAMAGSPADRYGSAAEFARALGSVSGEMRMVAAPGVSTVRRFVRQRPLFAMLAIGFLLGLGVLFAWGRTRVGAEGTSPAARLTMLAVLPFENLGPGDEDYFADGMTDQVRGKLASLPGLGVIASSSSNQYRRTTKPPKQIGAELGVQYLVVGKVRWEKQVGGASRVQVSPELVSVANGTTKWEQPFDALLSDVFEVQGRIAEQVAQALDVKLGTGQKATLEQRPTQNLAAYDAFLRGEPASALDDPISLRHAISYYEQAVALDSTFVQAWAELARAQALLYANGTPTPAGAAAARRAAERTVALAPNRSEGHRALGLYYSTVITDLPRALAEANTALELAPGSARALALVGYIETGLGRWEAARAHLEQAVRLDPLDVRVVRFLASTLLLTRHYPEARQACDRGLALAPTNLSLLQCKAMVSLGQGDLAGARAGLRAAPKEVDTALVAYMATYNDLMWVLDDAEQALLLRLRPRAFDGDRGQWGIVFAQTYAIRGDPARARIYADSARLAFEKQLRATPGSETLHTSLGLALAYLGRKAEAIREGERSVASMPITRDAITGAYVQHQLTRIYIIANEPEKALDQLKPLLKIPYSLSPKWLKIDPNFAPLRGNPRFEQLIAGP